ncbi:hypothetical protein [Blastococcus sp. SYSU D00820]
MTRTEHSPAVLPPVSLTPEEAAAVVVALAARPAGAYAEAGRGALEKVLTALEPDPVRRARLVASGLAARTEAARRAAARSGSHPAGRALARPAPAAPPRLTLLPGGLG